MLRGYFRTLLLHASGWQGFPLFLVAQSGIHESGAGHNYTWFHHLLVGHIRKLIMGGNLHSMPSIIHAFTSCIQLRLLDTYCMFTHRPFPGSVGLVGQWFQWCLTWPDLPPNACLL